MNVRVIILVLCIHISRTEDDVANIANNIINSLNPSQVNDFLSNIGQFISFNNNAIHYKPIENLFGNGSLCERQFQVLLEGVQNKEKWAIQMMDAVAKIPPGILYGNVFLFGNYDECIDVEHQYTEEKPHSTSHMNLRGQYCSAFVSLGLTNETDTIEKITELNLEQMRMMLGICIPASCTVKELRNISSQFSTNILPNTKVHFLEDFCSIKDAVKEIPLRSIIGLFVFGTFTIVICLATVADYFNLKGNTPLLVCFSMYSNGKKLFNTGTTENTLGCLNGLRVLSMILIALGHRFIAAQGVPAINRIFAEQWKTIWYNYIFIGLGFCVDTFFTISGLLVVYLYFKKTDNGERIVWPMYYIHRILRLMPSVLMLVLFYATMLQFIEADSFRIIDSMYGTLCRDNWLTTILYVQNYWNPNSMCAVQTWYLAVDTQLYILAPIFLIALKRYHWKAFICALVVVLLSILAAFEVTWRRHLGATFMFQTPEEYKYLFTPTHIRLPPWFIGALTGYLLAKHKDKSFPLGNLLVRFLWVLSLGILLFVLLIQKIYHDYEYNVITSALYNSFARPLWAVAICIIILLCVFGHGGMINSFLSCPIFNVLIRVNYAFYLTHMIVMIAIFSNLRTAIYVTDFNIIHDCMGDYFFMLLVSIIWTLAFESPIIALEKLISSKGDYGKKKFVLNGKSKISSCETIVMK